MGGQTEGAQYTRPRRYTEQNLAKDNRHIPEHAP